MNRFIIAPLDGRPARTFETSEAAARALLRVRGRTWPVEVLVGQRNVRPLTRTELRAIGREVAKLRERLAVGRDRGEQ
jgi:hypothetical protein